MVGLVGNLSFCPKYECHLAPGFVPRSRSVSLHPGVTLPHRGSEEGVRVSMECVVSRYRLTELKSLSLLLLRGGIGGFIVEYEDRVRKINDNRTREK